MKKERLAVIAKSFLVGGESPALLPQIVQYKYINHAPCGWESTEYTHRHPRVSWKATKGVLGSPHFIDFSEVWRHYSQKENALNQLVKPKLKNESR